MKILLVSNPPHSTSGYGQQTKLLVPRLHQLGHEVGILGTSHFWGLGSWKVGDRTIPIYPAYTADLGNDIVVPHASHFFGGNPRDGIVMTFLDAWVLSVGSYQQLNTVSWVPIDHDPAPPPVIRFLQAAQATPIAMSLFGKEKLEQAGFENPFYAPCAVNTTVFSPGDKKEARKRIGLPEDKFIVGMVGVNKGKFSRKSFVEAMEGFQQFKKTHEDAVLYMHTEATGVPLDGVRIRNMADILHIGEDVIFADQHKYVMGYRDTEMADIYRSLNVLLAPSQGEGFCVPLIEAQACGIPVIVSDFTSQTELCSAGWKISKGTKFLTNVESYQFIPDVDEIANTLEEAYKNKDNEILPKQATKFAQSYDIDLVKNLYWKPIMAKLEAKLTEYNQPTAPAGESQANTSPLTSVIVTTRDPLSDTTGVCLKNLKRSTSPYELIIINRDRDWTFSSAVNQGIRAAKGEYILLLNDDCYVEPETLETLIDTCSQEGVGIVGGLLYYPDGHIQHAGGYIVHTDGQWELGNSLQGQLPLGEDLIIREVPFVTGALMMIKKSVLDEIGQLDEEIGTYYEDADLCLRAKNAGYKVLIDPRAKGVHLQSVSTSQDPSMSSKLFKAQQVFARKYNAAD